MFLNPFKRRDNPFTLVVGMTGVKMGDRLVQIGCADPARLAAVAAKVGLSGRAAAVVPDAATGAQVERAASHAGVLVEVTVAPLTRLPVEDGGFDVAIVDDGAAGFSHLTPDEKKAVVRETWRVLRPGGRVMVVGATALTGLAGRLHPRTPDMLSIDPTPVLQADGYRAVRVLAERDGLIFYEGMKPRA